MKKRVGSEMAQRGRAAGYSLGRRDFLRLGGAGFAGVALVGVAGCAGGSGSGSGGGEHNFRLAETHEAGYPTTQGDQRFAELVRERSDGRIIIEVFPNSQLGEEAAVIEQVQMGAIELTRTSTSPMAEFAPSMGVFSLPYIFDGQEHEWAFLQSENGQALLGKMSSSGLKGLAYYASGARSFYTRGQQVQGPDDMRGLKIRVQKSNINVDFINAFGGSATPMDFGEVYSALQNGVLDGAENNWPSYLSTSHYEVASNYTLDEHTRVPEVLVMHQGTFDGLSTDDQEIIQQAAKDSVDFQRQKWDQEVQRSKERIQATNTNVIQVNDSGPWREAVRPMIQNYRDQYGEVLDQIQSAASGS